MPIDWEPLYASLRIAISSTALCLVIGLPAAWLLARKRVRVRPLWEGIVALPLVLPPTVLGYHLLVTLGHDSLIGKVYRQLTGHPLVFTWQGAALSVSMVSLPLLVRAVQISLMEVDAEIIDAARIDGAGEITIFRSVLLPLARRGLWAGVGLAFARALGDFGVTLMVGGNIAGRDGTHTMSLAVYDSINAGEDRRTAIVFVLLLSIISLALLDRSFVSFAPQIVIWR